MSPKVKYFAIGAAVLVALLVAAWLWTTRKGS